MEDWRLKWSGESEAKAVKRPSFTCLQRVFPIMEDWQLEWPGESEAKVVTRQCLSRAIAELCWAADTPQERQLVGAYGLGKGSRGTDAEALASMRLAAALWLLVGEDTRLPRNDRNLLRIAQAEQLTGHCRQVVERGAELLGHEAAAPYRAILYAPACPRLGAVDLTTEPFRPTAGRYELRLRSGCVLWPVAADVDRLTFVNADGETRFLFARDKGQLLRTDGAPAESVSALMVTLSE